MGMKNMSMPMLDFVTTANKEGPHWNDQPWNFWCHFISKERSLSMLADIHIICTDSSPDQGSAEVQRSIFII